MLIRQIIPLLALLLVAQSQSAALNNSTATPVPVTDFNAPEFRKVLDAVRNQRLETTGWRPSKATKQTAAGTVYKFRLTSDLGETADVTAAVNAQGAVSLTDFSPIVGRRPSAQRATAGTPTSFSPFTDYANSSFQSALEQVKWQNFYLFVSYRLAGAELLVSARFYYFRFNFTNRKNASSTIQIVACLSFETPAVPIPLPGSTGALAYANPDVLGSSYFAYNQLIDSDPSLSVYKVATVMSQSVRGGNYVFVLEKSVGGYERRKYLLTSSGSGVYAVAKGAEDRAEGYAQQVVDQVEAYATRTWKDLQAYRVEKVENVRADKTGLRLFFTKGTTIKFVELDFQGEDETLILYE